MNGKALGTVAAAIWLVLLACSATQAQEPSVGQQCPGGDAFIAAFNSEAALLNISDHDGHHCVIEEDHDDHDGDHTKDDDDDHSGESPTHAEGPSCASVAQLVQSIILKLNLTTEECIHGHAHNDTPTSPVTSTAQAYGYGFLMVFIVSLASLAGLAILPVIHSKSPLGRQIYEYSYAFMVALAVSALVSDAVLHLIPQVFNLHGHQEVESDHAHEEEEENRDYLWKACVVLAGIYLFYLLELFLHALTDYMKTQNVTRDHAEQNGCASGDNKNETKKCTTLSDDNHYKPNIELSTEMAVVKRDSSQEEEAGLYKEEETEKRVPKICDLSCRRIRPVAWLVIIGDTMHNFADGLAIGAAVSVSVPFGIATSLAILFHEIPHELGDYAILIKSGMHWFTALLFNFISGLTAVVGLFIGVAVSQHTATANQWILALTAGLFLYIGLVDLLPDLIHGDADAKLTGHGWRWWLRFIVINAGFLVSFAVLLLIAVFEDKIRFPE